MRKPESLKNRLLLETPARTPLLSNTFGTKSCLTGITSLSWVLPPTATKPGKPLDTVGMGITQRAVCQHRCTSKHTNKFHWYFSPAERRTLQHIWP